MMKLRRWSVLATSVAVIATGASASAAPLPDVIASQELPPGFVYGDHGIGEDGRYIVRVGPEGDMALWDRVTQTAAPLPEAGDDRGLGGFTDDGSKVLIHDPEPLVASDTNGVADVYLRDLSTGSDRRISLSRKGGQLKRRSYSLYTWNRYSTPYYPADAMITGNGRWAAFRSKASNLTWKDLNGRGTDLFLTNVDTGKTHLVSVGPTGGQMKTRAGGEYGTLYFSDMSDNGRHILFAVEGDSAAFPGSQFETRLFLWDRTTKTTTWIRDDSFSDPSISAEISGDGSLVVFSANRYSYDDNEAIYTYEPATGDFGPPIELEEPDGYEDWLQFPRVSDDGSTIGYWAWLCPKSSPNGEPCSTTSYLHDLDTGERVEIPHHLLSLSGDGNYALTIEFVARGVYRYRMLGPLR